MLRRLWSTPSRWSSSRTTTSPSSTTDRWRSTGFLDRTLTPTTLRRERCTTSTWNCRRSWRSVQQKYLGKCWWRKNSRAASKRSCRRRSSSSRTPSSTLWEEECSPMARLCLAASRTTCPTSSGADDSSWSPAERPTIPRSLVDRSVLLLLLFLLLYSIVKICFRSWKNSLSCLWSWNWPRTSWIDRLPSSGTTSASSSPRAERPPIRWWLWGFRSSEKEEEEEEEGVEKRWFSDTASPVALWRSESRTPSAPRSVASPTAESTSTPDRRLASLLQRSFLSRWNKLCQYSRFRPTPPKFSPCWCSPWPYAMTESRCRREGPRLSKLSTNFLVGFILSEFVLFSIGRFPEMIREVLKLDDAVAKIADDIYKEKSLLIMGRGFNFATCLEGALKIKELSYMHCEGIMSGELKHGPLAMVDEHLRICMVICQDGVYKVVPRRLFWANEKVFRSPWTLSNKSLPEEELRSLSRISRFRSQVRLNCEIPALNKKVFRSGEHASHFESADHGRLRSEHPDRHSPAALVVPHRWEERAECSFSFFKNLITNLGVSGRSPSKSGQVCYGRVDL